MSILSFYYFNINVNIKNSKYISLITDISLSASTCASQILNTSFDQDIFDNVLEGVNVHDGIENNYNESDDVWHRMTTTVTRWMKTSRKLQ